MRGAKCIVFRFTTAREPGQSALLAYRRHRGAPSSQNFMRIGLVSDIPHDAVVRCIEYIMQGNVSSTVPKLDDKCPPVRETLSSTKARSSSASCLSARRSSERSAAGSSIVLSNGYLVMV